jgi:hypothetical protein
MAKEGSPEEIQQQHAEEMDNIRKRGEIDSLTKKSHRLIDYHKRHESPPNRYEIDRDQEPYIRYGQEYKPNKYYKGPKISEQEYRRLNEPYEKEKQEIKTQIIRTQKKEDEYVNRGGDLTPEEIALINQNDRENKYLRQKLKDLEHSHKKLIKQSKRQAYTQELANNSMNRKIENMGVAVQDGFDNTTFNQNKLQDRINLVSSNVDDLADNSIEKFQGINKDVQTIRTQQMIEQNVGNQRFMQIADGFDRNKQAIDDHSNVLRILYDNQRQPHPQQLPTPHYTFNTVIYNPYHDETYRDQQERLFQQQQQLDGMDATKFYDLRRRNDHFTIEPLKSPEIMKAIRYSPNVEDISIESRYNGKLALALSTPTDISTPIHSKFRKSPESDDKTIKLSQELTPQQNDDDSSDISDGDLEVQ